MLNYDSSCSSSTSSQNKRVTFSQDQTGGGDVVIDVNNLAEVPSGNHWERYYGSTGSKFSNHHRNEISSGKSDYWKIFNSPYFDYRKTHSRVCSSPCHMLIRGTFFSGEFMIALLFRQAAMRITTWMWPRQSSSRATRRVINAGWMAQRRGSRDGGCATIAKAS